MPQGMSAEADMPQGMSAEADMPQGSLAYSQAEPRQRVHTQPLLPTSGNFLTVSILQNNYSAGYPISVLVPEPFGYRYSQVTRVRCPTQGGVWIYGGGYIYKK